MSTQNIVIARIKAAREELGWSQSELSRRIQQASNTIQRLESGLAKTPEKLVPAIAKATGMPISYFFAEESPELTEFAEKARKYDMLIEVLKESGILAGINGGTNSNGGENNVTVGGNGNSVNVGSNPSKIVEELMRKDYEEHELILKILELEKAEKDKLLQLYEVLKTKES